MKFYELFTVISSAKMLLPVLVKKSVEINAVGEKSQKLRNFLQNC